MIIVVVEHVVHALEKDFLGELEGMTEWHSVLGGCPRTVGEHELGARSWGSLAEFADEDEHFGPIVVSQGGWQSSCSARLRVAAVALVKCSKNEVAAIGKGREESANRVSREGAPPAESRREPPPTQTSGERQDVSVAGVSRGKV